MKLQKKLSDHTYEELKSKQKKLTSLVFVFGIFMLLASIFLIYSAIHTKNYAFIAIAMATSIAILPLIIQLLIVNKEIRIREDQSS